MHSQGGSFQPAPYILFSAPCTLIGRQVPGAPHLDSSV
ncbi:MAG: hypothetical protein [Olavius algarvensis Gamma 1 endosymbiont]|nr:MAG: hypothetical protein [Olavius algarvensis Gamma 1 endosymbiont]